MRALTYSEENEILAAGERAHNACHKAASRRVLMKYAGKDKPCNPEKTDAWRNVFRMVAETASIRDAASKISRARKERKRRTWLEAAHNARNRLNIAKPLT